MPTPPLDAVDLKILDRLQTDARTIAESIGAEVGLSAAAVQRRIKRLRQCGVIARDVSVLDQDVLGVPMTFVVAVEMEREHVDVIRAFRERALADDAVQQCYYVTGQADFILVVACRDMACFEAFTRRALLDNPDVRHFTTSVAMDRVKVGLTVPLG